jgi:hypothetical protein
MMEKKPSQRIDADFEQPLCLHGKGQGISRCPKMKGDDGTDGK